jgi:hypothetical protein
MLHALKVRWKREVLGEVRVERRDFEIVDIAFFTCLLSALLAHMAMPYVNTG